MFSILALIATVMPLCSQALQHKQTAFEWKAGLLFVRKKMFRFKKIS